MLRQIFHGTSLLNVSISVRQLVGSHAVLTNIAGIEQTWPPVIKLLEPAPVEMSRLHRIRRGETSPGTNTHRFSKFYFALQSAL